MIRSEQRRMARELNISKEILLPLKGESIAIAIDAERTAALCYDRVWSPSCKWRAPDCAVPDCVRFFGGTKAEAFMLKEIHKKEPIISEIKDLLRQRSNTEVHQVLLEVRQYHQELKKIVQRPKYTTLKKLIKTGEFEKVMEMSLGRNLGRTLMLREISKSFARTHKLPVIPIYNSEDDRVREYQEGKRKVIVAIMENLGIVYEFALTWEQVLEFRKDMEARKKYRRFLHWLDKEMIGKSQSFIEDEIAIKLNDYEESLKKHGIRTFLGTMSEILDGKYLLGSTGIAGTLTLAGHPTFGIFAGTGLIVGKIGLKLSQTILDYEDIERGPKSEISWVYEVKQLCE